MKLTFFVHDHLVMNHYCISWFLKPKTSVVMKLFLHLLDKIYVYLKKIYVKKRRSRQVKSANLIHGFLGKVFGVIILFISWFKILWNILRKLGFSTSLPRTFKRKKEEKTGPNIKPFIFFFQDFIQIIPDTYYQIPFYIYVIKVFMSILETV